MNDKQMNTSLAKEMLMHTAGRFDLDSPAAEIKPYGSGHINETFLVTTRNNTRYILQKISPLLTDDAEGLMKNIRAITD